MGWAVITHTHIHTHTKKPIHKAKEVIGSETTSHIRDESPQSKHMNKVGVKYYKVVVYFADSLALRIPLDKNHQYHIHARIVLCAQSALKAIKSSWRYLRRFDARIGRQMTPLNAAARTGHKNMVNFLIDRGALVNARNEEDHGTPLYLASCTGMKILSSFRLTEVQKDNYKRKAWVGT
jgi:hypothetical protein